MTTYQTNRSHPTKSGRIRSGRFKEIQVISGLKEVTVPPAFNKAGIMIRDKHTYLKEYTVRVIKHHR